MKINIGDRVSAEFEPHNGRVQKILGIYKGIDRDGKAAIDCHDGMMLVVPKSMRKIRMVKKVSRRKRWINCYPGREDVYHSLAKAKIEARPGIMDRIEMIEVRKKK